LSVDVVVLLKTNRFDSDKKSLHNLASLLMTQLTSAPDGAVVGSELVEVVVPCSLTTKQPISVGAWNECADGS